ACGPAVGPARTGGGGGSFSAGKGGPAALPGPRPPGGPAPPLPGVALDAGAWVPDVPVAPESSESPPHPARIAAIPAVTTKNDRRVSFRDARSRCVAS